MLSNSPAAPLLPMQQLFNPMDIRNMMTHKYRGCIAVLSINKSVEPNEEQKVLTSSFDQEFTVKASKQVFSSIRNSR
jgi:hypothetical protein